MTADAAALTASTLALSQTMASYATFMPPLREVRQAGPNDASMRGDVRLGQIAAGALSLGVALVLANMTGSTLPVTAAVAVALIIAIVYEAARRGERLLET